MLLSLLLFVSLTASEDVENTIFNLDHVLKLLRQERYEEAAEYATQLPLDSDGQNLTYCLLSGLKGDSWNPLLDCTAISDKPGWDKAVQCTLMKAKKKCPIQSMFIREYHYAEALGHYRLKDHELATRSIKVAQQLATLKDWHIPLLAAVIAKGPIGEVRKKVPSDEYEAFDRLTAIFQTEERDDWRSMQQEVTAFVKSYFYLAFIPPLAWLTIRFIRRRL